jgi:molybdopterin molybdotransferase
VEANGAGLAAQVEAAGGRVCGTAHAADDRAGALAALVALLDGRGGGPPDLLISVGGISVGAHDHLGPALDALGARWALRGVAMRPGHPVGVAVRQGVVVLALPGNAAAAAVGFHLLGRALLGIPDDWERTEPLDAPVDRHERAALFVRCSERGGGLVPLERQGSADLRSLAGARALAWIEPGAGAVARGTAVRMSRLP